jgi:hypothetical protein
LLPPSVTGLTVTTRSRSLAAGLGTVRQRDDRVYITTDRDLARACAGVWSLDGETIGGGVLYRVEPMGDPDPDDDLPGLAISFQVPSARVLAVVDAYVARNDSKYAKKLTSVLQRLD